MTVPSLISGLSGYSLWAADGLLLLCAFLCDAVIGDPVWLPHPVRAIGKLINLLEKLLYRDTDENSRKLRKGLLLTALVVLITALSGVFILYISYHINIYLYLIVVIIMSTYCIAAHDLKKAAMRVYDRLALGDLPGARQAVAMIVGRDTENLSEQGVIKAVIESVAESLSDGVIAPVFYIYLFGPAGGLVYKSINTMDSMIGYKNERYLYFGRAAAQLDDICNYIPSRLSALLVIIASALLKCDFKQAVIIWKRDRRKHSSPNSAQTESAVAGALGVRLGGPASYFGKMVEKPYLGDIKQDIIADDIKIVCNIMYLSSLLFILLLSIISLVILICVK